jgi:hypothetical protein
LAITLAVGIPGLTSLRLEEELELPQAVSDTPMTTPTAAMLRDVLTVLVSGDLRRRFMDQTG